MSNSNRIHARLAASMALAVCAGALQAEGLAPLTGAIGEYKPIVDLRLRSEDVEHDAAAEDADAVTLRGRLGVETGKAWGTSLLVESEMVWSLEDDYREDPAVAENTQYPVVADPEDIELNRLQLLNTSLPRTTITLGRQRIVLDDQRFVGNVGWRQNEQTFDALRVASNPLGKLLVDATYLEQVNRIFGPDSPQGRWEGDGYLVNLAWPFALGKLSGFGYLLDFDNDPTLPAALDPVRASTETWGLRFAGERQLARIKLAYAASWARQHDYADNPFESSNDYYLADLTASWRNYSVGLGNEVLEGDGVVGFSTPLATLHKFQGWADRFLATPATGIDDRYASIGYLMKGVGPLDTLNAAVIYHDFSAEQGGIDYGSEWNLQLQAKWQRFTGILKYADYQADGAAPSALAGDTSKIWAEIDYLW